MRELNKNIKRLWAYGYGYGDNNGGGDDTYGDDVNDKLIKIFMVSILVI